MEVQEKPTLHEIAAMPYPASEQAMRKHYDPNWGRFRSEGELRTYAVEIAYSYRVEEYFFCDVEATSVEEAEALAENTFDADCTDSGVAEIDEVKAKLKEG